MLSFQNSFAVSQLPANTVSIDPTDATIGSPIKINALVYNNQKNSVTFTIEFKTGDLIIGKPVVSAIPALSAKTVSVDWKQPETQIQVNVSITSAINNQRKDLVELHGLVGSILVGQGVTSKSITIPEGKIQEIYFSTREKIETFRKKQAVYFAELRDKTKAKLGIEIKDKIIENITPDFADMAPQVGTEKNPENLSDLNKAELDNPMDYGTLIYSTALASLFGIIWMFYTAFALLIILILRSLFRMFI